MGNEWIDINIKEPETGENGWSNRPLEVKGWSPFSKDFTKSHFRYYSPTNDICGQIMRLRPKFVDFEGYECAGITHWRYMD